MIEAIHAIENREAIEVELAAKKKGGDEDES